MSKAYKATAVIFFTAALAFFSINNPYPKDHKGVSSTTTTYSDNTEAMGGKLNLWYMDPTLSDYLNTLTLNYYDETGVRVNCNLIDETDYYEKIAQSGSDGPDIYLTGHESIELLNRLGVVDMVDDSEGLLGADKLPEVARNSVTYHGNLYGYPLWYDTTFMIYNKTYLENYAKDQIEATRGQEAADAAEGSEPEDTAEATWDEVQAKAQELIPDTFDELELLAEEYDAPEGVEAILDWEQQDVFYNYFFLGDSIDIGGVYGDDEASFDVVNHGTAVGMKKFQSVQEFFTTGDEGKSYSEIRDGFCDGKYVFTIASTDILKRIQTVSADPEKNWVFEIIDIPSLDEEIKSSPMSVTECICINSTSGKKDAARDFIKYAISPEASVTLFDNTGRLSPYYGAKNICQGSEEALTQYETSVPYTKLAEHGDFWMELEIAFMRASEGANAQVILSQLRDSWMEK